MEVVQILSFESNGSTALPVINQKELNNIFSPLKHQQISIVSSCGAGDTGKSFILNFIWRSLGRRTGDEEDDLLDWENPDQPLKGFDWKRTGSRCRTRGIWITTQAIMAKNSKDEDISVFLMDTQEVFDNQTTQEESRCILGFSLLLSTTLVFSVKTHMPEELLVSISEVIEMLTSKFPEDRLTQLIILVKDADLMKKLTNGEEVGTEYIADLLSSSKNYSESSQKARNTFKSLDQEIRGYALPFPGDKVERCDFKGSLEELLPSFTRSLELFLQSKHLLDFDKSRTGSQILSNIEEFSKMVPVDNPDSVMQCLFEEYTAKLNEVTNKRSKHLSTDELDGIHLELRQSILAKFQPFSQCSYKQNRLYEQELDTSMETAFASVKRQLEIKNANDADVSIESAAGKVVHSFKARLGSNKLSSAESRKLIEEALEQFQLETKNVNAHIIMKAKQAELRNTLKAVLRNYNEEQRLFGLQTDEMDFDAKKAELMRGYREKMKPLLEKSEDRESLHKKYVEFKKHSTEVPSEGKLAELEEMYRKEFNQIILQIPVSISAIAAKLAESEEIPVSPSTASAKLAESEEIPVSPSTIAAKLAESEEIPVSPSTTSAKLAESEEIPVSPSTTSAKLAESEEIPVVHDIDPDVKELSSNVLKVYSGSLAEFMALSYPVAEAQLLCLSKALEQVSILQIQNVIRNEDKRQEAVEMVRTGVRSEYAKAQLQLRKTVNLQYTNVQDLIEFLKCKDFENKNFLTFNCIISYVEEFGAATGADVARELLPLKRPSHTMQSIDVNLADSTHFATTPLADYNAKMKSEISTKIRTSPTTHLQQLHEGIQTVLTSKAQPGEKPRILECCKVEPESYKRIEIERNEANLNVMLDAEKTKAIEELKDLSARPDVIAQATGTTKIDSKPKLESNDVTNPIPQCFPSSAARKPISRHESLRRTIRTMFAGEEFNSVTEKTKSTTSAASMKNYDSPVKIDLPRRYLSGNNLSSPQKHGNTSSVYKFKSAAVSLKHPVQSNQMPVNCIDSEPRTITTILRQIYNTKPQHDTNPQASIGIHFGRSKIRCTAFRDSKFVFVPLSGVSISTVLPNYIGVSADKSVVIGDNAKRLFEYNEESALKISDMKIGQKYEIKGRYRGSISICFEEAVAIVLKHIYNAATIHIKCVINHSVITVPSLSDHVYRRSVLDAVELAGIQNVNIISECSAVISRYIYKFPSHFGNTASILVAYYSERNDFEAAYFNVTSSSSKQKSICRKYFDKRTDLNRKIFSFPHPMDVKRESNNGIIRNALTGADTKGFDQLLNVSDGVLGHHLSPSYRAMAQLCHSYIIVDYGTGVVEGAGFYAHSLTTKSPILLQECLPYELQYEYLGRTHVALPQFTAYPEETVLSLNYEPTHNEVRVKLRAYFSKELSIHTETLSVSTINASQFDMVEFTLKLDTQGLLSINADVVHSSNRKNRKHVSVRFEFTSNLDFLGKESCRENVEKIFPSLRV